MSKSPSFKTSTERDWSGGSLLASKDLFRSVFDSAPDAIVITNEEGNIQLVNNQTLKLFGYANEELIGKNVETLMPERFRGRHANHRTNYTTDPKVRPMGQKFDLSALLDVTERKQAEKALKSSEAKNRALLNAIPDMGLCNSPNKGGYGIVIFNI